MIPVFEIENRDFFPESKKNRNLDFITSLCVDFYVEYIYIRSW